VTGPPSARRVSAVRSTGACAVALAAITIAVFGAAPLAHDPPRTKVTWNGDIARLVGARCVRCHAEDGKAPMSLATYEDARPWAKAIREEVMARRMPKWHAARGYGQFLNDPSLSPFEVALFVSWVDGGALRGTGPVKLDTLPERRPPDAHRVRRIDVPCRSQRLPAGRLLAVTPTLVESASAGFVVILPGGRREILAWIKEYEAEFQTTYWLDTPLEVLSGSRLTIDGAPPCSVTLHMTR
jgi:hypothetical protein